jgi:hypothetical protein
MSGALTRFRHSNRKYTHEETQNSLLCAHHSKCKGTNVLSGFHRMRLETLYVFVVRFRNTLHLHSKDKEPFDKYN